MKSCAIAVVAVFALAAGASAQEQGQAKPDPSADAKPSEAPGIAGKWTMTVETPQGSMSNQLELKLDGKTVTGTITSDQVGSANLKGEFADGKLTFSMSIDAGGQQLDLTFTGALKDDKLSGSITSPMGEIPWAAVRVKG
jgi:hypothetical protein